MKRKRLLLVLLTLLCFIGGAKAQNELTVYEGTATNNYVPAYIFYFDDFTKSQFVIPAGDLTPMNGGTISKIKFYTTSQNVPYTTVSTVDVYLKEVDYTTMTGLEAKSSATTVYQGLLSVVSEGSGGSLTIELSTPYTYGGGNLLIGIENTTDTGYKSIYFYGQNVTGAAWAGYNSGSLDAVTGSAQNFIPQTTFTYTGGTAPFNKPTNIVVDPLQAKTATISWTAPEGATSYFYQYKEATMPEDDYEDNEASTSATSVALTGLTPNTAYNFRVKAIYSDGESTYATKNFTTPVSCPAPTGLTVTATTATSATLNWTEKGDATSWQICLNGDEDNLIAANSNPFTLTGLTAGTTYTAKVRAVGSGEYSTWTTAVNFTTDAPDFCSDEDKCLITLELTDSYGDGWNGNKIQVVDAETSAILGTYTLTSGSSGSFSLAVCPGREINFVWVAGNYGDECSFVIKDLNEDIILSHDAGTAPTAGVLGSYLVDCTTTTARTPSDLAASEIGPKSVKLSWTENGPATAWVVGYKLAAATDFTEVDAATNPFTLTGLTPETAYTVKVRPVSADGAIKWSDAFSFTTNIAAPTPTDLTASEIGPNSANLSWTGFADSYDVRYGLYPGSTASSWLQYDNGTYVGAIGNASAGTWTWGVMYPGSLVTGNALTKVSIYETSEYNTADITINVYSGGDDAPGTLLYTETVTPEAANAFHEITLASPVDITPGENLWITLTEYGTYVMAYCQPESVEPNDQWVESGGWYNIGDLAPSLAADCWMIRGYMEEIDMSSVSWTEASTTESSYQLTGLTAETNYVAQVRGDFGVDGTSGWATTVFTTPATNPIPTVTSVETTRNSATIEWTGASDSYKLKYRTTGQEETSYFTDFEHGLPEGWTTIDADGDGYTWGESAETFLFYARSGNNCMSSASYINGIGELTPDNWLISPKLTLNGAVKAWLRGQDESGFEKEHFAIYVSTTGTDVADFTEVLGETIATADYVQYAADLSSYAGQQGYIAIRHFNCTDQYWLNLDDFGVYTGATTEPGAWTVVATNETSVELTGLTEDTEYEFTVIGVKNGEENAGSDLDTFTPRASSVLLYDNGASNEYIIEQFDGTVADVTLRNRTLFKDDSWNTLCLPFNLTIAGSVLDGATAKTLTNATMTGTTVEFDFGEAVETLQAGVPYIIKWASGENIVNPVFTDVTINKSTTGQTISKADGNVKFIGYYAPFDIDETDEDIFYMTEDNTLMCTGTDRTLKAFRAYFQLSEAATSREFVLNFGDEATGINAPTISVDNDAWYTIDGRKLDKKPVTKGLYIHNGKKFVIK